MQLDEYIFKRDIVGKNATRDEDAYGKYKNAIKHLLSLQGKGLIKIEYDDADIMYEAHFISIEFIYANEINAVSFSKENLISLTKSIECFNELVISDEKENQMLLVTQIYK